MKKYILFLLPFYTITCFSQQDSVSLLGDYEMLKSNFVGKNKKIHHFIFEKLTETKKEEIEYGYLVVNPSVGNGYSVLLLKRNYNYFLEHRRLNYDYSTENSFQKIKRKSKFKKTRKTFKDDPHILKDIFEGIYSSHVKSKELYSGNRRGSAPLLFIKNGKQIGSVVKNPWNPHKFEKSKRVINFAMMLMGFTHVEGYNTYFSDFFHEEVKFWNLKKYPK